MVFIDRSKIVFLADMPPPIHGMSNVNGNFYKLLTCKEKNESCYLINTAPSKLNKFFPSRLWTLFKVLFMIFRFFHLFFYLSLNRKVEKAYRPINGGKGQIYDVLFILLFKLFRVKVLIHHHSFQYLNNNNTLSRLLFRLTRGGAEHVVLGSIMKEKLLKVYGIKDKVHIISNAFMFNASQKEDSKSSSKSLVIGHLANLCKEKGINEFLETFVTLNQKLPNLVANLAGPINDKEIQQKVLEMQVEYSNFHYLGPLYGKRKETFFKNLDIFIFPSKYINEAEPLVLYEAAAFGVFCIGSDVGCMADILNSLGGISISTNQLSEKSISEHVCKAVKIGEVSPERKLSRQFIFKNFIKHYKYNVKVLIEDFFYEPRSK
ncbi:glycosyltransferase family 4 protein [Pseudoalteromonas sp. NZS100]|uniref:glycosyltransferase family 4 protein n=1 Tax=Pseudoalteromonas sp. NZS100 TaxID=2792046 RepID=UPI0018CF22B5|nr:glycosyltransferase family 4 protein [Pseudoalteromonas sp. NZS100]MBH0066667.1 glycosyltransferase family 4 protein [Pseudoalteromonas sp. NZS100]